MRRWEPWSLFCGDPDFAETELLQAFEASSSNAERASLLQLLSRLGAWTNFERLLQNHPHLLNQADGRAALFHWQAAQAHPNPWLALLPTGEQGPFRRQWRERLNRDGGPIQVQLSGGLGDQLEGLALMADLPWRSRLQLVFPAAGEQALAPLLQQMPATSQPWRFGSVDPAQPWLSLMALRAVVADAQWDPQPLALFSDLRRNEPDALVVVCWRSKVDLRERLWAHLRSLPFAEIQAVYRWLLPWAAQQGVTVLDLTAYRTEEQAALQQLPAAQQLSLRAPSLVSLADSASWVARAQLVVSVDTALIHVAHGVAAPRWLLLHRHPDSRWQHRLQQDGSSDQRELKVLQQTVQEQWQQPLAQLRAGLGA